MNTSATLEGPLVSKQYPYPQCPAMGMLLVRCPYANVFTGVDVAIRSQITSLTCGDHPWRELDDKFFNIFFMLS